MKRLERFIDGHRKEGELLEQGGFTLCPEEALRKIASFGLESPEKALLRLVQLAVADGCSRMHIGIGRGKVTLRFENAPQLAARVTELPQEVDLQANNLGLVLLAALHSGFAEGKIVSGSAAWRFQHDRFEPLSSERAEQHNQVTLELQHGASVGFWKRLKDLLRARCLDYLLLREKLLHCPIAIRLDGRLLSEDPRPSKKLLFELVLFAPAEIRQDAVPSLSKRTYRLSLPNGGAQYLGPWKTYAVCRRPADPKRFGGSYEGSRSNRRGQVVLAHLWVPLGKLRPNVALVANGVQVGKLPLDFPLPVGGVVSAAGLDKDLSGLEVADNEKLRRLSRYLAEVLWRELARMGARSDLPKVEALLQKAGIVPRLSQVTSKAGEVRKALFHVHDPSVTASQPQVKKKRRTSRVSEQDQPFKQSRADFNVQRRSLRDRGRFK